MESVSTACAYATRVGKVWTVQWTLAPYTVTDKVSVFQASVYVMKDTKVLDARGIVAQIIARLMGNVISKGKESALALRDIQAMTVHRQRVQTIARGMGFATGVFVVVNPHTLVMIARRSRVNARCQPVDIHPTELATRMGAVSVTRDT